MEPMIYPRPHSPNMAELDAATIVPLGALYHFHYCPRLQDSQFYKTYDVPTRLGPAETEKVEPINLHRYELWIPEGGRQVPKIVFFGRCNYCGATARMPYLNTY